MAHKTILFKLSLFLVIFAFAGCTDTILYNSTNPPINLTKKAGEVYGGVGIGTNGPNFMAGFAPGDHFQVAAAFSNKTVDEKSEKSTYRSQELMLGYYNNFENFFTVEVFLGVATGSAKTKLLTTELFSDPDTLRHSGDFNKLFVQVNYGVSKGFFESGLSLRCSEISYQNVEKTRNTAVLLYKGSPKALLWEPVGFAKIGGENFKLHLLFGMPYIPGVLEIPYEQFYTSVGFSLKFSLY